MCIVLSSEQSKEADFLAEKEYSLSPRILVENAGRACSAYLISKSIVNINDTILIAIGSGFNGADGIVIAKVLIAAGFNVKIVRFKRSKNELVNNLLKDSLEIVGASTFLEFKDISDFSYLLENASVLIDCITGNGFSDETADKSIELVELVNSRKHSKKLKVISIDIPSFNSPDVDCVPIGLKADITIALQTLKKIHVEPSCLDVVGSVVLIDVGIPVGENISNIKVFDLKQARNSFETTINESDLIHKGNRPKVVIIGGSEGKEGAAVIAALGALRAGASLVTIASTSAVMRSIAPPEVMLHKIDLNSEAAVLKLLIENSDSVVIGPGLGGHSMSREIFKFVIDILNEKNLSKKIIVDADALKYYVEFYLDIRDKLKNQIVLTPHPKEFLHLLEGSSVESVLKSRIPSIAEAAGKYASTIVLKGPRSLVATGTIVNIIPHIEPILAVGGSGDLLSGVIGALLPRFLEMQEGVSFAVFVHAQAGSCASIKLNQTMGVFASEIGDFLPDAMKSILNSTTDLLYVEPFDYNIKSMSTCSRLIGT